MDKKPAQYSPLSLAYLGDSVYELYVRSRVISENPEMPAHKLHLKTVQYVKAHAQSNSMKCLEPILSEEEQAIYKRGRNAKSATVPKNADLTDYRRATGFEALIGYIKLKNDAERLEELMQLAYASAEKEHE